MLPRWAGEQKGRFTMTRQSSFPQYAREQYRILRTLGYSRRYARQAAIISRFMGHSTETKVAW